MKTQKQEKKTVVKNREGKKPYELWIICIAIVPLVRCKI